MTQAQNAHANTQPAQQAQNHERRHRAVDLGREDQLVPWSEWFNRTGASMSKVIKPEMRKHMRFRVTLTDGRVYTVRRAMSHVARGRCSLEPTRWDPEGSVCDVITGYQLMGNDPAGNISMLAVTPDMIRCVECVIMRPKDEEKEPFGFANWAKIRDEDPGLTEVEETETDTEYAPPADAPPEGTGAVGAQGS